MVAVSVSVASVVPELLAVAPNPVDPHPLDVLTPAGDAMVNVGSTSSMLSVECTSGMFNANVNDTALDAAVTGVSMLSTLFANNGADGTTTAVDTAMAVLAAMSVACANVTPTLRDASSAPCAVALVVTPVSIATVHRV